MDLFLGIGGALIAPLTVLAQEGRWQPEVAVIARGARLLLQHGSPYESQAVITASHDPNIYNPYLPVMAIFGLPRALLGPGIVTDPRIWFTLGFVAVFAAALAAAGARDVLRWTVLVTATPVIAFSLAVGGTDVPVLALLCLGLALLWRRPQPVLAGLVLGVAAATKATAWPALIVAGTMLTVRDGRYAAVRFMLAAMRRAVIIAPVAAVGPKNTILFPLGLAKVKSQAVSPCRARAGNRPAATAIAVVLLCWLAWGCWFRWWSARRGSLAAHHRPGAHVWRQRPGSVISCTAGLWAWLIVSQMGARHLPSGRQWEVRADPSGEWPTQRHSAAQAGPRSRLRMRVAVGSVTGLPVSALIRACTRGRSSRAPGSSARERTWPVANAAESCRCWRSPPAGQEWLTSWLMPCPRSCVLRPW